MTTIKAKLNKYFKMIETADLIYEVTNNRGRAIIDKMKEEQQQTLINDLIAHFKMTTKKGNK